MLQSRTLSRSLTVSFLCLSLLTVTSSGQTPSSVVPDISARLAAIEKAVEAKRRELNVPGLSIVIVQDGRTLLLKGFGLRDVKRKLPVTPDTLFPIASCTKAFTAMAAVIAVDEGKLSIDDSPKKYLPYFKLTDPDADAQVTIRDLLSHRTGIGEDDARIWVLGH